MTSFDTNNKPCSMFHSLKGGTVEHSSQNLNNSKNNSGTTSLKVLAYKVLERNRQENKTGTELKNGGTKAPKNSLFCSTTQNSPKTLDTGQNKRILEKKFVSLVPGVPPALICGKCFHFGSVQGSCWWIGACYLTGEKRSHNDNCNQGLLSHFEAVGVIQ